jgi:hypothetical protein
MLNKVKRQYTIQTFIETKYANRKLKKGGMISYHKRLRKQTVGFQSMLSEFPTNTMVTR